jgi:NAD(P)-dependent dehydrogenase (short-subunit alcohol dehydrogenase family)
MKQISYYFKNKTILITGSNGILGKEITNYFKNAGAKLILIDKIDFHQKNKNIYFLKCDFSKKIELIKLIKNIKKKFKKIDIVINNAAYVGDTKIKGWATNFENQSYDIFNECIKVNLSSVFFIVKSLTPLLKKSISPSVVNISSIYSFLAPDYNLYKNTKIFNPAAYGSSKAGLVYLTKWLSTTLSPKIRCNSISLGGVKRNQEKKFILKYKNKVPLNRMATANDLINSIIFLSSDMSNYITGQNLIVDGGISIK